MAELDHVISLVKKNEQILRLRDMPMDARGRNYNTLKIKKLMRL